MNNINAQKIEEIVTWIKTTVKNSGLSKIVIGLSGGVDSAVALVLAVRAIGEEDVYPCLFPYGDLHSHGIDDAKILLNSLKIPETNIAVINIESSVDEILKNVILGNELTPESDSGQARMTDSIRKGNIMARVRMIYLFDSAKKLSALVCGTENKTEHLLGYFTRFGDGASDIEPIRNFYKTEIWEMAKILNVPRQIIEKAPTAGLWEGQTDEKEFDFTYKDADKVLYYYFDEKLPRDQIVKMGVPKEVVEKVLKRVSQNDFKHKLPFVFK